MEKQRENHKITYLFGAGASFNSVPIWNEQGRSMFQIAGKILASLRHNQLNEETLHNNSELIAFFEKLKDFGRKAIEYGSIDIYAKRLFLLGNKNELNTLKHCLSVYFDLWENFYHIGYESESNMLYNKIDKRYYSLLSVLLDEGENTPILNSNVSFLSWNYDLQVENCYDSFLQKSPKTYQELNNYFNFMDVSKHQQIIHLNGFRGVFQDNNGNFYENLRDKNVKSIEEYLIRLSSDLNDAGFKKDGINYTNSIRYAWEADKKSIEKVKKILKETTILIIIGYSFPAFNRKIDGELMESYVNNRRKKVIYQDPGANMEILNAIFPKSTHVKKEVLTEDLTQFHIPQELLFPPRKQRIASNLIAGN